ncbi:unnamed protein product [Urochloa humidicola]
MRQAWRRRRRRGTRPFAGRLALPPRRLCRAALARCRHEGCHAALSRIDGGGVDLAQGRLKAVAQRVLAHEGSSSSRRLASTYGGSHLAQRRCPPCDGGPGSTVMRNTSDGAPARCRRHICLLQKQRVVMPHAWLWEEWRSHLPTGARGHAGQWKEMQAPAAMFDRMLERTLEVSERRVEEQVIGSLL